MDKQTHLVLRVRILLFAREEMPARFCQLYSSRKPCEMDLRATPRSPHLAVICRTHSNPSQSLLTRQELAALRDRFTRSRRRRRNNSCCASTQPTAQRNLASSVHTECGNVSTTAFAAYGDGKETLLHQYVMCEMCTALVPRCSNWRNWPQPIHKANILILFLRILEGRASFVALEFNAPSDSIKRPLVLLFLNSVLLRV